MSNTNLSLKRRPHPLGWLTLLLLCGSVSTMVGCSLMVETGVMLMGRPKIPAAFEEFSKKSLGEKGVKAVVICEAPMGSDSEAAALDQELQAEVSRRFKQHDIQVIDSHKVATWIDDNGGDWGSPEELFEKFTDADFLVLVDVHEFSYLEKDSPGLYRGRSQIEVSVYENNEFDSRIFSNTIDSVYPRQYPEMADRISKHAFRKRYVDQLSTQIARLFYEHRPEETFD